MRQPLFVLFLVLAACGDVVSRTEGTLGATCGGSATCNADLECVTNVCVPVQDTTCTTGQTECGGVCRDTQHDPMNCNACGKVCDSTNATAACVNGACNAICNTGFGNCDTDAATACTTHLLEDDTNCGFCGNVCDASSTCKRGICELRNVLVMGDAGGSYVSCVIAGLAPYYGAVTTVTGVPSTADLDAVDAVLVFNNGSLNDPAGLGDALANFFDAKGHVVEANYGTGGLGPMTGRWGTDNYRVLSGSYNTTANTLGVVVEPTSPLMVDVTTLDSTRSVTGNAVNGGVVVATFSDGQPIVVRGTKNGHNRADLGIFPGGCSGAYWTGDGFALMRNALNF